MKFIVFYGSVRDGRQGIKAARFIVKKVEDRGHEVELIDPLEWDLPLLKKMYKSYDEPPEKLEKLREKIVEADGHIVVSAEYNHSIPPALSNTMDHFLEEYNWKPSAIMCYSAGSFGGVRAAMQLRAFLSEVGTPSIPSILPVPKVQDAFDEEGNALDDAYHRRADRFLKELEWYARAFKKERENGTPY